jgi:hypothetical protein
MNKKGNSPFTGKFPFSLVYYLNILLGFQIPTKW